MLTEISLNVIDIVRNSVRAGATLVEIEILRDTVRNELTMRISDNGCGMSEDQLKKVEDPFYTSRKTRKVGLGIPFLKQQAEVTGGHFTIESEQGKGTTTEALFKTDNIDCMPLGDISSSIFLLVTTSDEGIDYVYRYETDGHGFVLDTREIRKQIGDIPLSTGEVASFIKEFLEENKAEVDSYSENGGEK